MGLGDLSFGGFIKFYTIELFYKNGHWNWLSIIALIGAIIWIYMRLSKGSGSGGTNYYQG